MSAMIISIQDIRPYVWIGSYKEESTGTLKSYKKPLTRLYLINHHVSCKQTVL